MLKTCTKCNQVKPVENFRPRMKRGLPYVVPYCIDCEKDANKLYTKAYKKHHITKEHYDEMLASQNGLCANPGCMNPAEHIDHDHACCSGGFSCGNCVVGILCAKCNMAEGLLEGDSAKILGLAEYVIKTRGVKMKNNNGGATL